MTDEDFNALNEYRLKHGRPWKVRLIQAWLSDWPEQWGTLRSIRNNPEYHNGNGCSGILDTFEAERRKRETNA